MRLCVGPKPTDCANLTWARDHYEGRRDNEAQPSSTYSTIAQLVIGDSFHFD
jgi:hypothetical protein